MKQIVFIVASEGFQPIELSIPRQTLEDEDIKVFIASNSKNKLGNAVSSDGSEVKVDFLLQDVIVRDFDGIFIVGGKGALEHLDNDQTYRIIHEIDRALNKIYGAICISTRILANAGVLDGRKVTGWNGDNKLKSILDENNAEYINQGVVVDRNIITADGPKHAQEFATAILQALYPNKIEKPYKA